jgi:LruC domain-containing protein
MRMDATRTSRSLTSLILLLLCAPSFAWAQDADNDGVPNASDAFPCDASRAAVTYFPGATTSAMLAYEDQWPGATDLDFNDVVLRVHYRMERDAAGDVVSFFGTIDPEALGGTYSNGLALQLPVSASGVTAQRRIGNGAWQELALEADANATIILSENLRHLFGEVGGPVNSLVGSPHVVGQRLELRLSFATPANIPSSEAPFDLFIFRAGDFGHQIHFPQYAGTGVMRQALFNSGEDASTPTRRFVHSSGVPAAMSLFTSQVYPLEGVSISSLFPDVVQFAASGGVHATNFYTSSVVLPHGRQVSTPTAPSAASTDSSCIPSRDRLVVFNTWSSLRGALVVDVTSGQQVGNVLLSGNCCTDMQVLISPNGSRAVVVSRGSSTSLFGYVATINLTTTPPTLIAVLDRTAGASSANLIPGPAAITDTYALVTNVNSSARSVVAVSLATGQQVANIPVSGELSNTASLVVSPNQQRAALVSRGNSSSLFGYVATLNLASSPPALIARLDRTTGASSANLIPGPVGITDSYALVANVYSVSRSVVVVSLATGQQVASISMSGELSNTASIVVSRNQQRAALVSRGSSSSLFGYVASLDLTSAPPALIARFDRTAGASSANLIPGPAAITDTYVLVANVNSASRGVVAVSLATGQQAASIPLSGDLSSTASLLVSPNQQRAALTSRGSSTSLFGYVATLDLMTSTPTLIARFDRTAGASSTNLIPGPVEITDSFALMTNVYSVSRGLVVVSLATGQQIANIPIAGEVSAAASLLVSPTSPHRAALVSLGNGSTSAFGYVATVDLAAAPPALVSRLDRTTGASSANMVLSHSAL